MVPEKSRRKFRKLQPMTLLLLFALRVMCWCRQVFAKVVTTGFLYFDIKPELWRGVALAGWWYCAGSAALGDLRLGGYR